MKINSVFLVASAWRSLKMLGSGAYPQILIENKRYIPKNVTLVVALVKLNCKNLFACDFEIYEAVSIDCESLVVKLFKCNELCFAPCFA